MGGLRKAELTRYVFVTSWTAQYRMAAHCLPYVDLISLFRDHTSAISTSITAELCSRWLTYRDWSLASRRGGRSSIPGIFYWQIVTGIGFFWSTSVSITNSHAVLLSSITQGWYNGPFKGLSTKGHRLPSPHPKGNNNNLKVCIFGSDPGVHVV
jgi:hypothetical protein